MSGKHNNRGNGSGNGHDKDEGKIVSFPSLAERDRIEREKREKEQEWQAAYKKRRKAAMPPFINTDRIPPFAGALTAAMLLVHLVLYLAMGGAERLQAIYMFGFMPAVFTGATEWSAWALITPVTHIFIHGGWMHVLVNAVMMLALGLAFEKTAGTRAAVVFFALCVLGGALFYVILSPFSTAPVIGASGGISGLFAAMLLMFHDQGRLPPGKYGPWPIIGFWLILFLAMGFMSGDNIAWQAHLGGFLTGIVLYRFRIGL